MEQVPCSPKLYEPAGVTLAADARRYGLPVGRSRHLAAGRKRYQGASGFGRRGALPVCGSPKQYLKAPTRGFGRRNDATKAVIQNLAISSSLETVFAFIKRKLEAGCRPSHFIQDHRLPDHGRVQLLVVNPVCKDPEAHRELPFPQDGKSSPARVCKSTFGTVREDFRIPTAPTVVLSLQSRLESFPKVHLRILGTGPL